MLTLFICSVVFVVGGVVADGVYIFFEKENAVSSGC